MSRTLLLGTHESVSGGLHLALERGVSHLSQAVQIFTKNARGWKARPLGPAEIDLFRQVTARTGLPSAAHASYLINLAAEPGEMREKSLGGIADELQRCQQLGVRSLIVHPGTHADSTRGWELVAQALVELHRRVPEAGCRLLLENTAGQGSSLGHRFEQLGYLFRRLESEGDWVSRRLGVCLDTCHLFAAGYDLSTPVGYDAVLSEFDGVVGLSRVFAFHLNDCKGPLGCRVDRHEDIGKGRMGTVGFEALVNDSRFAGLPGFLETEEGHQELNLAVLRDLVRSPQGSVSS